VSSGAATRGATAAGAHPAVPAAAAASGTAEAPGAPGEREERVARARRTVAPFRVEYPFEPHFHALDGAWMHYLDEGARDAAPLLMLHGNPTWSFFYRGLVRAFSDRFRCVVPDHVGCGLSDKPQRYRYELDRHVANLEALVLALDLRRITLVLHDWGGAIGMGFARRHPERVARLVILNTAAFLSRDVPARIAACRVPLLGQLAIRGFNAFARAATSMAVARVGPLRGDVRRGYLAPYDSWAHRIATWAFVRDIPLREDHPSWAELAATDAALAAFADRPACIVWGERDWCFTPRFRATWEERLPAAESHPVEDAGHYVLEDALEHAVERIDAFLERAPLP